jgi:hypothetical protein
VTSANVTIITNDFPQTVPLKLKSGTKSNGVWYARYKISHEYNNTYEIKMLFSDGFQDFKGGLVFR